MITFGAGAGLLFPARGEWGTRGLYADLRSVVAVGRQPWIQSVGGSSTRTTPLHASRPGRQQRRRFLSQRTTTGRVAPPFRPQRLSPFEFPTRKRFPNFVPNRSNLLRPVVLFPRRRWFRTFFHRHKPDVRVISWYEIKSIREGTEGRERNQYLALALKLQTYLHLARHEYQMVEAGELFLHYDTENKKNKQARTGRSM